MLSLVSHETISRVLTPIRATMDIEAQVGCCHMVIDLRYLCEQLVSSHAKRLHSPTRLSNEGEGLTNWQLWYSHGSGHLFGHMKPAGDYTC